jgi:hypothetical protein
MYFAGVFCVAIMLVLLRFGPRNASSGGDHDVDHDDSQGSQDGSHGAHGLYRLPSEGDGTLAGGGYYQSSMGTAGSYGGALPVMPVAAGSGGSSFELDIKTEATVPSHGRNRPRQSLGAT